MIHPEELPSREWWQRRALQLPPSLARHALGFSPEAQHDVHVSALARASRALHMVSGAGSIR